ncbi:MAG: tRNA (N6-isopentenyl adenosine(37)-C2)-methylthiotransferase MiaB [Candidatus Gastranaerophilales bacterium]|nr:tRNA (N6-isopentenyl adenosine(37)-C2)-methylthiotransferase MiaB [Candidatus Gastranaerophilales bacterium]
MKKVYIETLGCQMNKSDAERMFGMLEHLDYEQTNEPKEADLLIINTCSIRQLSEDKAYSQIGVWGKWKKTRPHIKIGFSGCVAQQVQEKLFKRAPYVDFVIGTQRLYELPEIIKRIENDERVCSCEEKPYEESDIKINRVKSVNAWVPIMEGCNNFCSYCIVPYTRGRERSRNFENIMTEVKKALSEGFKEITLLGQNVDSYKGTDKDGNEVNLSALLKAINALDGKFRIRFVTSYPTDITEELIDTVIQSDKVCEYFHIPMQSGDDYVLKKMNRRYDVETYSKICNHIRTRVKDVTITSDFIAGFPGETEEQFQNTLDTMLKLELDYSNTAAYSPRERTVAAKWTDKFLSEEVKTERLARLNERNRECCVLSNGKYIGREMEVLVEKFENHNGKNVISGRTRNNKMVHIPCDEDKTGEFVNVKINGSKTWYLTGELI